MAHHASAKKRIRQNHKRRLRNRHKLMTMRKSMKKLHRTKDKAEAQKMLPEVVTSIDKCAKANIIHRNNAARKKSAVTRFVSDLG